MNAPPEPLSAALERVKHELTIHGTRDPNDLFARDLATLVDAVEKLTEACRLFTRGLGDDNGYYSSLGGPRTALAIRRMREAGVQPIFYRDDGREQLRQGTTICQGPAPCWSPSWCRRERVCAQEKK